MSREKKVLTGNESIARGFFEAGGSVAASYPGSPTVGILESMKSYGEIYSEFSLNEKVALEVAIGSSIAGARSMVIMKHVGLNIALDPFMTFTQTRVNGGFVLVSGDDPGMSSSQNEQDNRILGKFANIGVFDPADSMEAKVYTKEALELSEKFNMPMMIRITSRACHARSVVEIEERKEIESRTFEKEISRYCMIPPNTFRAQYEMQSRVKVLQEYVEGSTINAIEEMEGSKDLIITSGVCYMNLKELVPKASILKLGLVYPLPLNTIGELLSQYERIIVIEEMMPFIEDELKINGISCIGKEKFSFTGELGSEEIAKGLEELGIGFENSYENTKQSDVVMRSPMFCAGCPHRPVFDILKKTKVDVIGDIGCYSMGVLYPFEGIDANISMGASVGMIKGMRKALSKAGDDRPLVGLIGDGTFFHSGMTGFVNLLEQLDEDENMTMIVLDNRTTAMTGGQDNASSGNYPDGRGLNVDIGNLLKTFGIRRVISIDQFDYKEASKVIKEEISHKGLSVIIATRPCALKYKIKETAYYVDQQVCIGCRSCVKTNCPPIQMRKYDGIEKLKSSIDKDMCVGCGLCSQVCPVGAIKRLEEVD